MRTVRFVPCLFLFFLSTSLSIQAQSKTLQSSMPAPTSVDRERDGLNGPVRRVRVETAKILFKNGEAVEAPRVVQEIFLYDQKGGKIDSVAYPAEASSLQGKEEYKHDSKGNIVEMTVRGNDGSILGKEKYDYEFDELDNWKKKTTSLAIFENGQVSYEPTEVTYRAITYYYNQAIAKVTAPAGDRVPATSSAPKALTAVKTGPEKPEVAKAAETKAAGDTTTSPNTTEEAPPIKRDDVKAAKTPVSTVANSSASVNPPVTRMSEEDVRKAAIELPQPEYPAEAMMAGLEGKIEVQLLIEANGEVSNVRSASGNPLLTEAAEQAARRARFGALSPSNQGAKRFGVITYNFVLPRPEKASNASASSTLPVNNSSVPANENKPSQGMPQTSVPAASKVGLAAREENPSSSVVPNSPESATSGNSAAEPPVNSLTSATPFEKGMASLASEKYAAAVEFFKQAVQRDPKDALAYCRLGLAHSALQQHKEAIAAFRQAINLNRAFVDIDSYFRLGTAYLAVGDQQAAVKPLQNSLYMIKAQALDSEHRRAAPGTPTLLDVRYALGLAFYGSGSFRDAAREFEAAVGLKEDFASAHYALGLSYLGFGDKSSAEKQERILRTLKSPLADKLTNMLMQPGVVGRNKVF